jgi:hypothetical protein
MSDFNKTPLSDKNAERSKQGVISNDMVGSEKREAIANDYVAIRIDNEGRLLGNPFGSKFKADHAVIPKSRFDGRHGHQFIRSMDQTVDHEV